MSNFVDAPTFSECVIGYRGWVIDALGQLRPLVITRAPWHPGVNVAACHHQGWSGPEHPDNLTPHPGCACGFYALHRRAEIAFGPYPADDDLDEGVPVIGAIAAFGRLLVHRAGFRAERAGVVALATVDCMGPLARARIAEVAQHYRVACVDGGELEQEASRHGTPLPDAVLPTEEEVERDAEEGRKRAMATFSVNSVGALPAGTTTYSRLPSRAPIYANAFAALCNVGLWFISHSWMNLGALGFSSALTLHLARERAKRKRAAA